MGSCPDTDVDPVIFYVFHAVIQQLHGYHNTRKTKVSVVDLCTDSRRL